VFEAAEGQRRKKVLVRIYEARLSRGTTTLWHSHDRDTAYVVCSGGDEDDEERGESTAVVVGNETVTVERSTTKTSLSSLALQTGQTFCFLAGGAPFVHRLLFPEDSARSGAHIVGVEVSQEDEEGEDGGGDVKGQEKEEEQKPSPTLPTCYSLVQKSKFFDFYKLRMPNGASTGKHCWPPHGSAAAAIVSVKRSKVPLQTTSSSSFNEIAWASLTTRGGAFVVFEGGEEVQEVDVRNEGEEEFQAAVVVVK